MSLSIESRTGHLLKYPAKWLACFGGLVLVAIALLTVVSVIGRALTGYGLAPIRGDFELVEIGSAVAVFCFLPWCQLNRGHVRVDILANALPHRINVLLEIIGDIAISLIAMVITWRIWMGMGERVTWFSQETRDMLGFGYKPFAPESTYILGWPTWYGYAVGVLACALFTIISLYTVWRSFNELIAKRPEQ